MGVGGQLHAPAALPPGKRPGNHFIGGWVPHDSALSNSYYFLYCSQYADINLPYTADISIQNTSRLWLDKAVEW
jgi:hypothetical protein